MDYEKKKKKKKARHTKKKKMVSVHTKILGYWGVGVVKGYRYNSLFLFVAIIIVIVYCYYCLHFL